MINISVPLVVDALQFQAEKKSNHLLFSIFLSHLMSYSSLELRPVTLIFNVGNILLKVKVIEDSGFLSMHEIFRSLRVVSMVV